MVSPIRLYPANPANPAGIAQGHARQVAMPAPSAISSITVGALGGHQDQAIGRLVDAIQNGESAVVTGTAGTGALLDNVAFRLAKTRVRVLRAASPLDLPAFMDQVAPTTTEPGPKEPGIERAFTTLTEPGPDCDRIALLVADAHTLPPVTLRYIDWALRSGPSLSIVLAGQAETLDLVAAPSFAPLRERLTLHLVVHVPPAASTALTAPTLAPPRTRRRPRSLAWFWGCCAGVICVGGAALVLLGAPLATLTARLPFAFPATPAPALPAPVVADTPRIRPDAEAAIAGPVLARAPSEAHTILAPVPTAASATTLPAAISLPASAAPVAQATVTPAASVDALPEGPANQRSGGQAEPDMAVVPRGAFLMGSAEDASERPPHMITVPPFRIARHAVTARDWDVCVAASACPAVAPPGASAAEPDAPAVNVSWNDARQYAAWLSATTGHPYRLPSEAEWEYAARGGSLTRFAWGNAMLPGKSGCRECGGTADIHHPPAAEAFPPNPFGLYGMGGGVAEWVADCWHRDFQGAPQKPLAWDAPGCSARVLRGGSWMDGADDQRVSARQSYDAAVRYPTHGFRLIQAD